jgi:hypothetical protein
MNQQEHNYDKLRAAIHYICQHNGVKQGTLDDVKLNKVLWYADASAYMMRGQSITGTTYIRKPRGPVARGHIKAVNTLIEENCIREGHAARDGNWPRTLDSTKPADTSVFSKADLALFDKVYDYVDSISSRQISDQSHGEVWKLARDKEEIPFYTVFAEGIGKVTEADIKEAMADLRA